LLSLMHIQKQDVAPVQKECIVVQQQDIGCFQNQDIAVV